jgi:hypothetical protein
MLTTYRSQLQVTITLSLIHTLCSSLEHAVTILSPVFAGCLVTASHTITLSASAFTSLLAGDSLAAKSVLLRNGGCSGSHASPRGDCLSLGTGLTAPEFSYAQLSTDWLVFRFSRCSSRTAPQRTPLPTVPLFLRDVIANADVTCSSATCKHGRGHVT